MELSYFVEQAANGVGYGLMLFLMAAGLTLVFGVMDTLNLAHGSLFMAGGYGAALAQSYTGSFITALVFGVLLAGVAGVLLEAVLVKHLYRRDHLTQVLATFGVVLIAEDLVKVIFGSAPLLMQTPPWLAAPINLMAGFGYPSYRAFVLACGLLAVVGLFSLLKYSRLGMQLRAGAFDRPMAELMGVRVRSIFTATFALGAALAGLAGAPLVRPLRAARDIGLPARSAYQPRYECPAQLRRYPNHPYRGWPPENGTGCGAAAGGGRDRRRRWVDRERRPGPCGRHPVRERNSGG